MVRDVIQRVLPVCEAQFPMPNQTEAFDEQPLKHLRYLLPRRARGDRRANLDVSVVQIRHDEATGVRAKGRRQNRDHRLGNINARVCYATG
jgi:hypothetical protein